MNQDLMNRIQAMMQQRGASGNGIMGYASGGGVPRQTEIGGQPHMLAYINPEEEQMLYAAGGSGEPGPGGVPAFRTYGMSPGEAGARGGGYQGGDTAGSPSGSTGYSDNNSPSELAYLANARHTAAINQAAANAAIIQQEQEMQAVLQDAANKAAIVQQEADLQAAMQNAQQNVDSDVNPYAYSFSDDSDYTPTAADMQSQMDAAGQNNLTTQQVESQDIDYSRTATGQDFGTASELDTAVSGFEYGNDPYNSDYTLASTDPVVPVDPIVEPVIEPVIEPIVPVIPQVNAAIPVIGQDIDLDPYAPTFGDPRGNQLNPPPVVDPVVEPQRDEAAEAFRANEQRRANASGANIVNPFDEPEDEEVNRALNASELAMGELLGSNTVQAGINLGASDGSEVAPSVITSLAMGDGTESPTELQNIKNRVSVVEGTSDAGGYNRLLGGQENNFNVKLTEMTAQEVLDFQSKRGPNTYAGYSQDVNKGRNFFRKDGITPQISTPAGKYQATGQTVAEMIDRGIIKPNDLFNEVTQEKIGDYLITQKRGYDDYVNGDITLAEFEKGLGNEFEGIAIQGLGDISVASADEIDKNIVLASDTGTDTGESTSEYLRRTVPSLSTNTKTLSGDGVQVASASADDAFRLGLGMDDLNNLVTPASAVADDLELEVLDPNDIPTSEEIDPIDGITEAPDVETRAELTERLAKEYEDPIDNRSNEERLAAVGALKTKNTAREEFANLLTPNDGAVYINGQLVDEITGQSMTGGGYSSSKPEDYVYGVSDFSANNAEIDSTTFSSGDPDNPSIQENVIKANKKMREDIPPSDLAYFASFLPGAVIPVIGQALGEKMLSGGIEDRKALIKAETDALKAGAEPRYDDDNNYIGHMTYEDQLANVFGSGNIYNDGTTFNKDGSVNEPGLSLVGGGTTQSDKVIGEGSYVSAKDDYNTPAFVDPYASTAVPDSNPQTQDEIDYLLAQAAGTATAGGGRKGPVGKIGVRKIKPRVSVPVRPEKTGDSGGVTFRTPKQFAQGGSVTPNIDSFFSNLR